MSDLVRHAAPSAPSCGKRMNQRSNRENTGEYREDHPKWEFSTRLALQCPEQNRGCHSEHDDSPRQVTAGMNPRRTNKKARCPVFAPSFWREGGRAQTSSTPSSGANGVPNAFQFRGPRRQVFVCGVEFVGGESKNLLLSLVSFKTDFVDWTRATNSHSRDRIGKEATDSMGWSGAESRT